MVTLLSLEQQVKVQILHPAGVMRLAPPMLPKHTSEYEQHT